ncbi:MAG: S-methyl-5-thioribose-1-phosphate isomerase, partial [candidate division Zixibacteria bacterium]|nr:S-methyl-5-thioribose-1-phosphate isomerase [candidate division Zixibacteria bacterium]
MAEIKLPFRTLEWKDDKLVLLDQKVLPHSVNYVVYDDYRNVIEAIKTLTVRGAPAIGVAAGYAVVLASREFSDLDKTEYLKLLRKATEEIIAARPTAVNLRWAVERLKKIIEQNESAPIDVIHGKIKDKAVEIEQEDIRLCRMIGDNGAKLIANGDGVLTHCNAGALATAGIGTALGVIYTAASKGKKMKVFAGETRPLNQGKRITAWELAAAGLDVT